jgi:hypothetical protein
MRKLHNSIFRPSFFRPANRVFLGLHPRVCGLQFGVCARDGLKQVLVRAVAASLVTGRSGARPISQPSDIAGDSRSPILQNEPCTFL